MAVKLHEFRLIERAGDLQLMMSEASSKFYLMTALDSCADGIAAMQAKRKEVEAVKADEPAADSGEDTEE